MTGRVTGTVAGLVLSGCALVAGAGAAVPGQRTNFHVISDDPGYPQPREPVWYWPAWLWVVVGGLAVAGVVLVWRPAARRPVAAVGAVLGAQIAGRGFAGVRDLFEANGAGTIDLAASELATMVTVAAAMAIAGVVAVCVGVAVLWREPSRGWAAWRPRRPGLVLAGAVVAAVGPLFLLVRGGQLTSAAELALTGPLPWGCALVGAAWLGPRVRRATIRTVIACALAIALDTLLSAMR